jgi:hypothetical protein
MLKNGILFLGKLELFVFKRVLILLLILTIADMIFFRERMAIFAGLLIGAMFGAMRFHYMAEAFKKLLNAGNTSQTHFSTLLRFFVSLLGAVAILAASIVTDLWLFGGAVTGILLVPFVLTVNSLTEGFGITHNNFE